MGTAVFASVGKGFLDDPQHLDGCSGIERIFDYPSGDRKFDMNAVICLESIDASLESGNERPFLVGFAAESQNVLDYARGKLKSKKADMIVGNLISGPEGVVGTKDTAGIIIAADGEETEVPRCSKHRMADIILDAVEKRLK